MQSEYTLSASLQEELQRFFNNHDITLLKENLRRLLVDFLDYELRGGVPLYFDNFLYPFNSLLDVLDAAGKEMDVFEKAPSAEAPAQQPVSPQEKVIAFLKASLNPEKIFLLHHAIKENGEEAFDLLVIIPSTSKTGFHYYEQVISLASIENAAIHVSLHKAEVMYEQLKQGHLYYTLACSDENLVYDNGAVALPQANSKVLKLLAEKATHDFNLSHKKADSFLNGASNYYGENDKQMAAFMLQQATELTLRGLITGLSGNCVKTHCFKELKKQLKRYAPELLVIFSANEVEENRLLGLLEKAYLEARYSNQLVMTDSDLTLLTEGAENLHVKAATVFKQKLALLQDSEENDK